MIHMIIAFYDGIPEVVSTRNTTTLAKYDWHNFLSNSKFRISRDGIFESFESGYFTDENGFELRIISDNLNPSPGNSEHLYDLFDEAKEKTVPIELEQKLPWFDSNTLDWNVEIVDIATWLSRQKYIIFGYDGNIAGSFVNATKLTYEEIITDKLWDDQYDVEIEEGIINGKLENGWFTAVPVNKIKEF